MNMFKRGINRGAQCTPGKYFIMVEAEVDKRITPIAQAEFGLM